MSVLMAIGSAEARSASCDASISALQAAQDSGTTDALPSLLAAVNTDCAQDKYPNLAFCAGRSVALSYYEHALGRRQAGASGQEIDGIIETAARFGKPWQVLFAIGELSSQKKDYNTAADYFQLAMNEFSPGITGKNKSPCPEEVATLAEMSAEERNAQAQQLMKRIETASLLADRFSPPPAGRDGEPGGLFQRGIGVESRALPVTFVYKESRLTPKGEEAFRALVDYLRRGKAGSIVLSGHTDPIGSNAYNCGLARQRLDALTHALSRELPDLQVTAIAVGEFEPFVPDDAGAFSEDEINQLNRRVKLIEGGALPPRQCKG